MDTKDIPTSSFELGLIELQKCPVYSKMSDGERAYYVNSALEKGKKEAEKMQEKSRTILQLIEDENIKLVKHPAHKYSGEILMRGEIHFTKKECCITVFEDSVNSIYENLNESSANSPPVTDQEALEIHLSHEFFHYLEFKSGNLISEELDRFETKGLFGIKRQVEVLECSEIAAHAFAKQFCQLNVLPNYYDLQYIYQKK